MNINHMFSTTLVTEKRLLLTVGVYSEFIWKKMIQVFHELAKILSVMWRVFIKLEKAAKTNVDLSTECFLAVMHIVYK